MHIFKVFASHTCLKNTHSRIEENSNHLQMSPHKNLHFIHQIHSHIDCAIRSTDSTWDHLAFRYCVWTKKLWTFLTPCIVSRNQTIKRDSLNKKSLVILWFSTYLIILKLIYWYRRSVYISCIWQFIFIIRFNCGLCTVIPTYQKLYYYLYSIYSTSPV